jgi:hypothetical protein
VAPHICPSVHVHPRGAAPFFFPRKTPQNSIVGGALKKDAEHESYQKRVEEKESERDGKRCREATYTYSSSERQQWNGYGGEQRPARQATGASARQRWGELTRGPMAERGGSLTSWQTPGSIGLRCGAAPPPSIHPCP